MPLVGPAGSVTAASLRLESCKLKFSEFELKVMITSQSDDYE
jgi:hypothetical protein